MSRALLLGARLNKFNSDEWVHLRNREDFDRIYSLSPDIQHSLEQIYDVGRTFASHLG